MTCNRPTPTYNKSHEANVVQTVIIWLPATSTDLPRTAHRVGPTLCRIKSELLELLHSAAVYRVSMKILSQIMGCCQDWSWPELIRLINWNQASRCQEGLDWTCLCLCHVHRHHHAFTSCVDKGQLQINFLIPNIDLTLLGGFGLIEIQTQACQFPTILRV